jgi:hypothetical protein
MYEKLRGIKPKTVDKPPLKPVTLMLNPTDFTKALHPIINQQEAIAERMVKGLENWNGQRKRALTLREHSPRNLELERLEMEVLTKLLQLLNKQPTHDPR